MSSTSSNSTVMTALNRIRENRKTTREEILHLYGPDGVFVFDVFQARYSTARKEKDGRPIKEKREDVLKQMEEDLRSGNLKNPVKEYKRQELYTKVFITLCAVVSGICIFAFGGLALMLLPPIWIVVILLLWIIKKMK